MRAKVTEVKEMTVYKKDKDDALTEKTVNLAVCKGIKDNVRVTIQSEDAIDFKVGDELDIRITQKQQSLKDVKKK